MGSKGILPHRSGKLPVLVRCVLLCGALVGAALVAIPAQGADPSDTFYGTGALAHVTTGVNDSAFGYYALNQDTDGQLQHGQRLLRALSATRPATTTRPAVLRRSIATRPAAPTRPTVLMRSITTRPGTTTRPPVLRRSLATRPGTTTRPAVIMRSLATRRGPTTRRWATVRCLAM